MINIYKITNTVNGKIYIGRTKSLLEKRLKQHIWSALRDEDTNYFRRAIRKYGKEKFTIDLLEQCDERIQHDREIHYIKINNSLDAQIGYNINWHSSGSNGEIQQSTRLELGSASKKFWNSMTPLQRSELLSKRLIGRRLKDSHKMNLSQSKRGTKTFGQSKFFGVCLGKHNPRCIFYYPNGVIDIKCKTETEAAELWDQLTCCVYGNDERLNFPEKAIPMTTGDIITKLSVYFSPPKCRYKHISISKGNYNIWKQGKFVKKFNNESDAVDFAKSLFNCEEEELLRPPSSLERFISFLSGHRKTN